MDANRLYIATIDANAAALARDLGLGLELDEFCMASNMDGKAFAHWDAVARAHLACTHRHILHLPFAELYPAAIDPLARALAMSRLRQAASLAFGYGIRRLVAHAGYLPHVYDPVWFIARSADFWREFLSDMSDACTILLENVLEDDPSLIAEVLARVDDPRLRACLDVGHAYVYSSLSPDAWMAALAPWLCHAHLSNNHGDRDAHGGLDEGGMDMEAVIARLLQTAPDITLTLEMQHAAPSAAKLLSCPSAPLPSPSQMGKKNGIT